MIDDNPNETPVWSHEHNQPYAKKTILAALGAILGAIAIIAFVAWYFLSPSNVNKKYVESDQSVQNPKNPYQENTGKSRLYNAFYNIFGGIEEVLEDSPLNLKNNQDYLNRFKFDVDKTQSTSPNVRDVLLNKNFQNIEDGYRSSFFDVINNQIFDRNGNVTGSLHDIVVFKETGQAVAIIVDKDENNYSYRDLALIEINTLESNPSNGKAELKITETTLDQRQTFNYAMKDNFISLKDIRNGRVLDYQGKVAGAVDAIIYNNLEAQRIFFELKPILTGGSKQIFGIPFDAVKFIQNNKNEYDIQLTKEQTEHLAKILY